MFYTMHPGAPAYVENIGLPEQTVSAVCGSKNEKDQTRKDDLVITPGGPRPADQVHPVGPGQVLRRNPDGTYSIVPDTTPDKDKGSPAKQ